MMYTFPNKFRNFTFVLMALGLIGLSYGFLAAPKTVEEAQEMVANAHGDDHGGGANGHGEVATTHGDSHENGSHHEQVNDHEVAHEEDESNNDVSAHDDAHGASAAHGSEHGHDEEHAKHVFNQLKNKPWAALYVAAFFFMMISLGVLAFYAIQRAAQAGWSPVLYRVMEAITGYLLPGTLIVFFILVLSGMHLNHLFIWMDPEVVAHDELIRGKVGYLNVPFFLARALFYIAGWSAYRYFSRKFSLAQDNAPSGDISNHKINFRISAAFLVFYIVTESMMS